MRIIIHFMIVVCAGLTLATARAEPTEELQRLFQEYWDFEMREDPFWATSSGVYALNGKVPKVAPITTKPTEK